MSRTAEYSILELETQESFASVHRSIVTVTEKLNGMIADLSLADLPLWDDEDAALLN